MIVSKGLTDSLGTAIDDHDVRSLVHDWDVDGPDWRAYPKPERDNEHYVQLKAVIDFTVTALALRVTWARRPPAACSMGANGMNCRDCQNLTRTLA